MTDQLQALIAGVRDEYDDTHTEEDAPSSSEEMPYPTPEDPQRVIIPKFRFIGVALYYQEEDDTWFFRYGGEIYDYNTGELLEPTVYSAHPHLSKTKDSR